MFEHDFELVKFSKKCFEVVGNYKKSNTKFIYQVESKSNPKVNKTFLGNFTIFKGFNIGIPKYVSGHIELIPLLKKTEIPKDLIVSFVVESLT